MIKPISNLIFKNVNLQNNTKLIKTLHYDTVSLKGKNMKKPLYFEYADKLYTSQSSAEKDFVTSLSDFVNINGQVLATEKSIAFSNAYDNFKQYIYKTKNNSELKLSLFCHLVEALDSAKNSDVAEKLNYYLFTDFIECFGVDSNIKNAAKDYVYSDLLKRNSLSYLINKYFILGME